MRLLLAQLTKVIGQQVTRNPLALRVLQMMAILNQRFLDQTGFQIILIGLVGFLAQVLHLLMLQAQQL
ncbi:MAG: hypothetical protein A3C43_07385 [Candidatus Schekmanbacteria bacterium RIFCSPHIGHO2_02_FULL_38_11]|uniref:Uncharacterized protein n=1 Tax=Candidatus Schekmanbacteria bacterium RIFCSPLOWO2_12_FULL_38_15 TaxID=1817883 RepID=A0A1F7SMT2_9BACT|nr:MAG: hypothetical protein A3C43_07385 [Candidatus Schekmanbacteria bacterium RIFCSPHIGHO2_02_FULL_38_11]OGL54517.1 MAG: hypothetical protein A3G31_10180 [Candidatus Schekmanbacteria bacterium RIFCSPLOWO2_12_FULL_38_15]